MSSCLHIYEWEMSRITKSGWRSVRLCISRAVAHLGDKAP